MTGLGRRTRGRGPRRLLAAEVVYLAGLGVLFGSRMLMIEHYGRRTGVRRYAVVKVLRRPSEQSFLVAARDGGGSQWYLNVTANPHVRLYNRQSPAGRCRSPPTPS
jgi:deazaflavin-dependent oxidoreductase (nitroreductase family)